MIGQISMKNFINFQGKGGGGKNWVLITVDYGGGGGGKNC